MTVTDVNALVQRFEQAAKMMKTVARGGTPQVPGMGPIPGASFGGGRGKPAPKKKQGSRSGNPAKRAAENAARAEALTAKPAGTGGAGFGLGGARPAGQGGPNEEDLAAMQKLLGR
jgi:signal recognition particle subunit SRP54